eukprot:13957207-Heterocapsa_arctica.AAC.1
MSSAVQGQVPSLTSTGRRKRPSQVNRMRSAQLYPVLKDDEDKSKEMWCVPSPRALINARHKSKELIAYSEA